MKCRFCGNEIEEGAKYCPICGTEVTQENGNEGNSSDDYNYGQTDNNIGGYTYGQTDRDMGGYTYGQSENNQRGESSGQSDDVRGDYSYGQGNPYNQPNYGQMNHGYNQSDNNYDQPNYSQPNYSQPNYSQPNYGQPNYGQPVEPINGTPYLVFSILATLCCCLPLGVASIIYASKINSLQRMGDYAGAKDAAKKAKIFCISSAIVGVIASIVMGAAGAYDVLEEIGGMGSKSSIVLSPPEDDIDEDDEDKGDKEETSKSTVKAGEGLGESWDSYTVQINDTVLTFPCSIEEVEAAGLTMDMENTPEDYVINADDYELVFFDDSDSHSLMFVISNNTEEAHVVRECTVNGLYVDDYDVEDEDINVIFPGGIQMGADIETVIEKWGKPDDVYEGDYSDSYQWYGENDMNYCIVYTEPGEGEVTSIDLDGKYLK